MPPRTTLACDGAFVKWLCSRADERPIFTRLQDFAHRLREFVRWITANSRPRTSEP